MPCSLSFFLACLTGLFAAYSSEGYGDQGVHNAMKSKKNKQKKQNKYKLIHNIEDVPAPLSATIEVLLKLRALY